MKPKSNLLNSDQIYRTIYGHFLDDSKLVLLNPCEICSRTYLMFQMLIHFYINLIKFDKFFDLAQIYDRTDVPEHEAVHDKNYEMEENVCSTVLSGHHAHDKKCIDGITFRFDDTVAGEADSVFLVGCHAGDEEGRRERKHQQADGGGSTASLRHGCSG